MRAYAASSRATEAPEAVLEVARGLHDRGFRRGRTEGCALAFASAHHALDAAALSGALSDLLSPLPFVGWVGSSAFRGLALVEGEPGLSVLVVEGAAGFARAAPQAGLGSHIAALLCADAPPGRARFLAAPADELDEVNLLRALDEQGVPLVGGVCVPASGRKSSALAAGVDERPHAAMLSMEGVQLLTGVAQGARQLGPSRRVTAGHATVVQMLDRRPALDGLMADLPPSMRHDLAQLRGSLLAGIAARDGGAFVMRHVAGVDPTSGAIAVEGEVDDGAELVFALRDGEAARADLEETLLSLAGALEGREPLAVVVMSGSGRDAASFGVPLYDVGRAADVLGASACPVVGVSAAGEVCTVGVRTELFHYSAVICALLAE